VQTHLTLFPLEDESLITRFWSLVGRTSDGDSCWLWHGNVDLRGYGRMNHRRRAYKAYRLAWELAAGPIPEGTFVCHTCDTPTCVRNDGQGWYEVNGILRPRVGHLFLGSPADNAHDMFAKGRDAMSRGVQHSPVIAAKGEANPRAKVTEAMVREMRHRHEVDGVASADLATAYGLSVPGLRQILNRTTWKHVKD
jgi:hypothetical protein